MSAWALDSFLTHLYLGAPSSPETTGSAGSSEESGTLPHPTDSDSPSRPLQGGPSTFTPWWVKITPFFLSALLFGSRLFAVIAPLPLLLLAIQASPRSRWIGLALLSNSIIVYYMAGPSDLWLFFVWVAAISLALPAFLKRTKSINRTVGRTWVTMVLTAVVILGVHSQVHHVNPFKEFKAVVFQAMDQTLQGMPAENRENWLGELNAEEWKQSVFIEIPWILGVFSLVTVWVNLALLIRVNPKRIRESLGIDPAYFRKWKASEILLWPTIASGFLLVVDLGLASEIALNVFKFLMAVYAIQGLSVLSFFFEAWSVRGTFRVLAYLVAVSLMLPLILSLGFFDLWFDFRSKLRQS